MFSFKYPLFRIDCAQHGAALFVRFGTGQAVSISALSDRLCSTSPCSGSLFRYCPKCFNIRSFGSTVLNLPVERGCRFFMRRVSISALSDRLCSTWRCAIDRRQHRCTCFNIRSFGSTVLNLLTRHSFSHLHESTCFNIRSFGSTGSAKQDETRVSSCFCFNIRSFGSIGSADQ